MIDDTLEYYRPIPEAPGYSVSRDGEIIDQHGSPAGTLVYSPWGDVGVRLMVEGAPVIKSPWGWAALAWAVETPEHKAQRLKLEQLRQRVAAAEAIVLRSKNHGEKA
ncbi:MAG: hypothetical protein K9K36_07170 [Desulfarculaceae bacterium]|nr:hypothetical protein [Desulfarculaceae bacterium]